MKLTFRTANLDELDRVYDFYNYIIDSCQGAEFSPKWVRDVYPTREDLQGYVDAGLMVLGELDGALVAAAGISIEFPEGYDQVAWPSGASLAESGVIHLLCISPTFRGQGFARELVDELCHHISAMGLRVARLDVIEGNKPESALYESCGFTHVCTRPIYYEDTGWTTFLLYEKELS